MERNIQRGYMTLEEFIPLMKGKFRIAYNKCMSDLIFFWPETNAWYSRAHLHIKDTPIDACLYTLQTNTFNDWLRCYPDIVKEVTIQEAYDIVKDWPNEDNDT